MNRKTLFEILAIVLPLITVLFGDNIYLQVTGKPFFTSTNIKTISITLAILIGIFWTVVLLYRKSNEFVLDTNRRFISCSLNDGKFNLINNFIFYGKNKSQKPITRVSGYLRSNITNETYPIYMTGDGKCVLPNETNGIPPKCDDVAIIVPFVIADNGEVNLNYGIGLETFLATLVDSTLTLELDGKISTYRIPERKVRNELEAIEKEHNPPVKPKVSRRNNY